MHCMKCFIQIQYFTDNLIICTVRIKLHYVMLEYNIKANYLSLRGKKILFL